MCVFAFGPKARAQCVSSARWDLCGGPPARAVPTAIRRVPILPFAYEADGEREPAKRLNRKAVSTVAGRAGGPARSSGEASAGRGGGGAKGPGHLWCVRPINRERASGRSRMDRLKPSGRACVRGSGGQDDKSPVTRDCHAGICGSRKGETPSGHPTDELVVGSHFRWHKSHLDGI